MQNWKMRSLSPSKSLGKHFKSQGSACRIISKLEGDQDQGMVKPENGKVFPAAGNLLCSGRTPRHPQPDADTDVLPRDPHLLQIT